MSDEVKVEFRAYPVAVVIGPVVRVSIEGMSDEEVAEMLAAIAAAEEEDK